MREKPGREVDEVGKDIGRVGKNSSQAPPQNEEAPATACALLILFVRQERKNQRDPGQEQVPGQEAVAQFPSPKYFGQRPEPR